MGWFDDTPSPSRQRVEKETMMVWVAEMVVAVAVVVVWASVWALVVGAAWDVPSTNTCG